MSAIASPRERVREAGGEELSERLEHLDASWAERGSRPRVVVPAPEVRARRDVDVAIAGGGLSLLIAPLLADRGLRVAVFDRATVGVVHREWNGGARELSALIESGLFSAEEAEGLVVARYAKGVCRWFRGGTYPVTGVLDHAFDAERLLSEARARASQRGVAIHDGHTLIGHAAGPNAVRLRFATRDGGAPIDVTARVLVDARGASSPDATADLICPTVGGVVRGLEEGDGDLQMRADTGEILATTDDVDDGRQHIWEAFPGRAGETTVYLFFYARSRDVGRGALMPLFARFFERLPSYKRGDARLVRPTFGMIPGWSRLCAPPSPPGPRVALVGDAAARHSPLTFCGFGATVRSLASTADAIAGLTVRGDREGASVVGDAPIHAGTGALARLMAAPSRDPARAGDLNDLLDTAFRRLHAMGNDAYAALLRDEMGAGDFVRFLRGTAAERPRVYREVWSALAPGEVARWGLGIARELSRARRA